MKQKLKTKFETQFVVVYRNRYWGLNFEDMEIKELTFEDAFGSGFFDWDNNICIATDKQKEQYDRARKEGWIGKIVVLANPIE